MSSYISLLWSQLSVIFWREQELLEFEDGDPNDQGEIPQSNIEGEDEYLGTWEWFLSPVEKEILNQLAQKSNIINDELQALRRTNQNFQSRTVILERVTNHMATFSEIEISNLKSSRISLVDQASIFRTLFKLHTEHWLNYLRQCLELKEEKAYELGMHWEEQQYAKNIMGQILSKTLEASVAAAEKGLTQRILCDIVWRLHLSLSKILVEYREDSVSTSESEELLNLVIAILPDLVNLWVKTWKNCEKSRSKEGQLPGKWAQKEEEEQQRLQELKDQGRVDAKFQPRVEGTSSAELELTPRIEKDDFQCAISNLSASLIFRMGSPASPSSPSKSLKEKLSKALKPIGRGNSLKEDQIREVAMLFNSLHGLTEKNSEKIVEMEKMIEQQVFPKLNPERVREVSSIFTQRFVQG